MNAKEMDAVVEALVTAMKRALDARVGPLEQRLEADEGRLTQLEARPELKYCGVFQDATQYDEGSLVTRSGALWLATSRTAGAPGGDPHWRLIVKSGHAQ